MEPGLTIDEVRDLEQYFITTLRPNLNEHEVVVRNGMAPKSSRPLFIYDTKTGCLVFKSNSILYLLNNLTLTGTTIRNCADSGNLFLNRFIFTYEPLDEGYTEDLISIKELDQLFIKERPSYRAQFPRASSSRVQFSENQPNRKLILAENLKEPHLTKEYPSAIKAAAALSCSPNTILNYLKDSYSGKLYLNKWKFREIKKP